MPLPTGFNSRQVPGRRTFRFFATGSVTATDFVTTAHLFTENGAANVTPLPVVSPTQTTDTTVVVPTTPTGQGTTDTTLVPLIWSGTIRVVNDGGGDLQFSFDGVNVHGLVKSGEERMYRNRHESGIALKSVTGSAVTYRVEAW